MPIKLRNGELVGDVAYEIARLERLTADLERLGSGRMPDPAELAAAPLLDDYVPATRPVRCLVGNCTDHPRLNGPLVYTTDLWVFAPAEGWCRTLSRFYRLGKPREGGDR